MDQAEVDATLRAIAGPSPIEQPLVLGQPLTIGRSVGCALCLVDGTVSREHAAITWQPGSGTVTDLRSARGTFVNGVRIAVGTAVPILPGDLIGVGPWTFRLEAAAEAGAAVRTLDDTGSREVSIERLPESANATAAERKLELLIECIAGLNAAEDDTALARAAVHAALKGTSFRRAAMLRGAGSAERLEVVASLRRDTGPEESFVFSRSLVREALRGHTVALSARPPADDGRSIMDMGIQAALCVPVRLAGEVDAVLYLDSRRGERTADAAGTGYCEAVARACGWALANLRRADLDRRQAAQEREMTLAREAQRVLLAPESGECGPIRFAGRVRPGLSVAGDLFDVMPLPGGRAAVCIGDVSGHGLGPGIVMAMTQANLHAHLALSGDPARALSEVNRFVCGRVEAGRFISLWLGVIGADGTVAYVDAGHGHVRIVRAPLSVEPNGRDRIEVPPARGDIPLGIDPDRRYTAEHLHLGPRDRLVLYSDGIVEQRDSFGQEFGIARLEAAVQASDGPGADVQAVFEALDRFTRGAAPTDDATAASIALNPGC